MEDGPRRLSVKLLGWLLIANLAYSTQLFVDSSRVKLVKAVPDLTALEFDPSQSTLDALLRATGLQLESMLAGFRNVSMAEDAHELRFESVHLRWSEKRDQFQYVIRTHPLQESRPGQYLYMLTDFMAQNQNQSRFRYLGRITEGGKRSLVVAFVTLDGARQGLAWIDDATKRIVRLRTDILKHPEGQAFDSLIRDVRYVPVMFSSTETPLWLPARATVHVWFSAGELHSVHRFSNYLGDQDKGEAAGTVDMADDPFETLVKGIAALTAGKPEDALVLLLDAAPRLADRIEPGYYLGLALYRTHDLAEAEKQFRETVRRAPNLAVAHNNLGAVLMERGDKAGALAEAQEALRLDPENSKLRANLERVTPAADASNVTIKVDVRQVLVPVVVTDKEGHHVTGLAQPDFKVFEDGVEQKITGFASERADIATPGNAGQTGTAAATSSAPDKLLAKGRTYVICLDMMHASFSNFVYVREALRKLFREEQAGDSQYAVIALGRKMQVLQNTTSDPAKVLETFAEANFKNIYQPGESNFEIAQYERDLQEVRAACDAGDISCGPRKKVLPSQAESVAEQERLRTAQFLAEFRSVVEQLARSNGRRTLILMSDGFSLSPAKTSFDLLEAYFPDLRSLQSLERMQDSIEPVFKLAVKANVPIYTIDSRGLYTSPALDASRSVNLSVITQVDRALNSIAMDAGQTLSEIAAETGGKSFQNSNDLSIGLKKAFADGREYYMLAYVPSNEVQDGKFRKIEVRVRDNKALVSAKRGYWATAQ
jgi:VWFA-related protein